MAFVRKYNAKYNHDIVETIIPSNFRSAAHGQSLAAISNNRRTRSVNRVTFLFFFFLFFSVSRLVQQIMVLAIGYLLGMKRNFFGRGLLGNPRAILLFTKSLPKILFRPNIRGIQA